MSKKLKFFAMMLTCILLSTNQMSADLTYTLGWGTASGASGTYTNFTTTSGSVTDLLSFSTAKNSSGTNPAYNSGSSELRLYNSKSGTPNYTTSGNSITITPASGVTITGFTITATANYQPTTKYKVGTGSLTTLPAWSSNQTSASGLSVGSTSSITIQNCNSSSLQLRVKTIAITYTTSGSTKTLFFLLQFKFFTMSMIILHFF